MSKSFLYALPLVALISNAFSQEHKVVYNDIIEKTIDIFRTCAISDLDETVLLAGEYDEFLRKPIFDRLPVALITESKPNGFELFTLTRYSFALFEKHNFTKFIRKLRYFLVVSSSQPSLRLRLQRIKDSTWSNSDGFYVLIDRRTEERGCRNAFYFLWAAWEYDLISAVFLCIDPEDGIMVYTYNPYSERVPEVWQVVRRFDGRDGQSWLMVKRRYDSAAYIHSDLSRNTSALNSTVCKDLFFDKTVILNGYRIKMDAVPIPPLLNLDLSKPGWEKFSGDNGDILKIVFSKLNATLEVTVHNGTAFDLGGIGPNGTMVGMLADVSSGKIDIGMNTRPLYFMWKIRYTYPHAEGGLCVITQPSRKVSELRKILNFMTPRVAFGIILISAIVHAVLAKHEGHVLASLNMIRILISVSMLRPPKVNSSRIFVVSALVLVLIVNTVFQGHLAALLTVPVSRPNIDTFSDLKKSGYAIYGAKFVQEALFDPVLVSRFQGASYEECKRKVHTSKRAACLGDCLHLLQRIRHDNLHRSRKLRELVLVYVTRENWPLFNRVNRLIQKLVEAGLVRMWRRQNARRIFFERRVRRMQDKSGFKVLRLKQLLFTFYLLAIGYGCATVAFLVEVKIGKRPRIDPSGLRSQAKCSTLPYNRHSMTTA